MSGHSKWSTIKRQKGAADAKRGVTFTKLSNAISIAVKQGAGVGDPNQNPRLRLAIEAARGVNMPKENIQRAIDRVLNKEEGDMEEVVYEGFGPGGVSVIVEAITDNKNRTTPEIKNIFEKNGGTLGQMGSVAYQFKQQGMISIAKDTRIFDEVLMDAADAGAQDGQEEESTIIIYTPLATFSATKESLRDKNYTVLESEITRLPLIPLAIEDKEMQQKIMNFLDKLEVLDDVQKTYTNAVMQE